MNRDENERHLRRVLDREAFEHRDIGADAERKTQEAALKTTQKFAALKGWLRVQEVVPVLLKNLNDKLSAIGAELKISDIPPHDYSHEGHPSLGRARLDLYVDGRKTTRTLEVDMAETGRIHIYMYLPKETRQVEMNIADADADRIEEVLIDFVDLAVADDFPRHG